MRSNSANQVLRALCVAMTLLAATPAYLVGCLEPDGANDADYIAAGAAMQGKLLFLRVWFGDKTTGEITGVDNVSAAYYNERCVLTAAHNLDQSDWNVVRCEVSTGPNYVTNRGTIVPGFKYAVHPEYNPNDTGSGPDLAIVYLAAALPGRNAEIGSCSIGEVLTHAGFGSTATPSTPTFRDRNSRSWNAAVEDWVHWSSNPTYYAQSSFYPYIALNGKGLGGDSGGPVYNSGGELVGINKAEYGGTSVSGGTIFLKLSQPDVLSWIEQNTTNLTVNPPNLALNGVGVLNLTGDTNQIYGLLSSTNLTEWQEIGLVTNLTGSVTFQDTNAPNFAARFYRAVAK